MRDDAGELVLHPALAGVWPFPDFPERVSLAVLPGASPRAFAKARWRQGYPGVIEQYREETPTASMHLMVYGMPEGGMRSWKVDHLDDDNPDMGRPIQHFFADHPLGKAFVAARPALSVVIFAVLLERATR